MKIFKILAVALVAMLGFTACDKETEHIYDDHSADLVGTWTCLTDNYAEALIINADGSAVSYGVENGEYWENVRGTVVVKEGNITMTFEDNDNFTGHFDIIPGQAFSLYEDSGERYTYQYCANDLADEIIGMWVATTGPYMSVEVFNEDGSAIYTGFVPESEEMTVTSVTSYKVVGDLQFHSVAEEGPTKYVAHRLIYSPSSQTQLGETMTWQVDENISFPRLRIKQHLDLAGKAYDYSATYISNAKGEDKDIPFLNTSFNFAKMDGSIIDKFLKSILFNVEFPDANTLKYSYLLEGQNIVMTAPIEVDGNKMTIKMSQTNPVYKDVVVYTFQDQDNTQMHLYMPTASFEKFFANTSVAVMLGHGQLDINDAEAIAGVYQTIADAVESINLSIVMHSSK